MIIAPMRPMMLSLFLSLVALAQEPPGPPPGEHRMPPPKNLKILKPDEVMPAMRSFTVALGVKCDFCHMADPKNVGPNGRPRLKYDDDSKPDKQIARIMYTMTQQMNAEYISKAMDLDKDGMGKPVTCGTCHRGHEMPEEFVIPREERRGGPGGGEGTPPPPAGATPTPN